MPTPLGQLETRRDAILVELAGLDATRAGGLPNSTLGEVDHVGYRKSLYDELEAINRLIAAAEGPFEIASPVEV